MSDYSYVRPDSAADDADTEDYTYPAMDHAVVTRAELDELRRVHAAATAAHSRQMEFYSHFGLTPVPFDEWLANIGRGGAQ